MDQQSHENGRNVVPIMLYGEKVSFDRNRQTKVLHGSDPEKDRDAYEREYIPWSGSTAKGYCKWRVMLEQHTTTAPLTTVKAKINGTTQLLQGSSKKEWLKISSKLFAASEKQCHKHLRSFLDCT